MKLPFIPHREERQWAASSRLSYSPRRNGCSSPRRGHRFFGSPGPRSYNAKSNIHAKLCELDEAPGSYHSSLFGSKHDYFNSRWSLGQAPYSSRSNSTSLAKSNASPRVAYHAPSATPLGCAFYIKGNSNYNNNGICYEKQDVAYSIQSRKVGAANDENSLTGRSENSVLSNIEDLGQGHSVNMLQFPVPTIGKPAALRGGSPTPTPGPGAYTPKSRPTTPAYSIGSRFSDRDREERQASPSPGPGSHNMPGTLSGPAFTISPRFRASPARQGNPGPGSHNLPVMLSGPAFSISPRLNASSKSLGSSSSPGPGHYAPKFQPSGPAFTIVGKASDSIRRAEAAARQVKVVSSSPSAAPDSHNAHARQPGHGAYHRVEQKPPELGHFIVKVNPAGPYYKITSTGTFLLADPTPGPGPTRVSQPAVALGGNKTIGSTQPAAIALGGKTIRHHPPKVDPGPGAYQHLEFHSDGPFISIKSRIPVPLPENFPGPGAYKVQQRPSSPSFSLGARITPKYAADASKPGPGTYTVQLKPQGPAFSIFGRSKDPPPPFASPGPGTYTVNNGNVGRGLPMFTITGKPRTSAAGLPEVPGPGAYPVASPRGLAFSITRRLPEARFTDGPGPGAYHPQRSTSAPSFSIRGRCRGPQGDKTPGPGSYPAKSSMEGHAYSLLGKLKDPAPATSGVPGPGAYSPVSRPTSPSFSLYGPLKMKVADDSPGPGAYSPRSSPDGPVFSLKGKLPSKHRNEVPGPGAYDSHSGRSSPSYSIKGKLNAQERSRSPGPAQYALPDPNDAPAFSLYGRIEKPRGDIYPGPGAYDAKADKTRFTSPPKYSFGMRL